VDSSGFVFLIWSDSLWCYAGFHSQVFSQNFQHPLAAKLYVRSEKLKRCKNGIDFSITIPGMVVLELCMQPQEGQKNSTLFFFLFLHHAFKSLNGKVLLTLLLLSHLNLETVLTSLNTGKFEVVHVCSTLSLCCKMAPSQNDEFVNTIKYDVFRPSDVT